MVNFIQRIREEFVYADEFLSYLKHLEQVCEDERAKEIFIQFREIKIQLVNRHNSTGSISENDQKQFQFWYDRYVGNKTLSALSEAEKQLFELVNQVYYTMMSVIEDSFDEVVLKRTLRD